MRKNMKFPFALVVREKHGDYQYLIEKREDLVEIGLKLLNERESQGWYFAPTYVESENLMFEKMFGVPLEDATKMAEINSNYRLMQYSTAYAFSHAVELNKREWIHYKIALEEYNAIQEAIKSENGAKAFNILWDRSSEEHEYEGIEMVYFENVEMV